MNVSLNENSSFEFMHEDLTLRCMKCDAEITPNGKTGNALLVANCSNCNAVNLLADSIDRPGTYYVTGVSFASRRPTRLG